MSRRYYAASWPYGVASTSDGRPCYALRVFASRSARDAWVASAAHVARTEAGYRSVVLRASMSARELRVAEELAYVYGVAS